MIWNSLGLYLWSRVFCRPFVKYDLDLFCWLWTWKQICWQDPWWSLCNSSCENIVWIMKNIWGEYSLFFKPSTWNASPRLHEQNLLFPVRQKQSNACAVLRHWKSKFVYFVLKLSQTKISSQWNGNAPFRSWYWRVKQKSRQGIERALFVAHDVLPNQPTFWSRDCYAAMQQQKWISGIFMRKRVL